MHNRRAPILIVLGAFIAFVTVFTASPSVRAQNPQRLVESVNVEGNRRNRDEDLLYYVQTKVGEPYNADQVQRDLQTLLALGFFDKSSARVETGEGARGGVDVTFVVNELPIIRDIQFEGLHSVAESDILKAFRERRIGVSKEAIRDPVKIQNARRVIRELLAAKGHPNATVEVREDEVSQTSTAITFVVNEGKRVRVVEIQFEGNQIFSDGKLRSQMKYVQEAGLITRFRGQDILDREKLEVDMHRVQFYMRSKGYLQARIGEPRVEGLGQRRTGFFIPLPLLSSIDEGLRVTIPVTEGKIYRIGKLTIEGNSIYSEQVITNVIGLKPGDIANGERIGKALQEDLKKAYGAQGFIQYEYDVEPTFKDNPQDPKQGIVDFKFTITEGKQFTLRRLEFLGNTFTRDNVLRREVLVNEGDVYNQRAFEISVLRLNQLGFFDPIDHERDADFRTDEEEANVDINLKVTERGRQQISFNGGISGIGGSFFGLEYSTNNLFGRGETLSFNLAYGNRQRSFQFSFTEPYFRNRPITLGFSVFTYSQKFFGEGTFLSGNASAQQGLLGSSLDFLSVGDENLFTRTSTGASVFASSPLSEFLKKTSFTQLSRVGLSYQISQTSVKDPAVNSDPTNTNFIPVIYGQPNILTSRVTGSFAYDSRGFAKDPNDPVRGRSVSASMSLSGLGGDVRTYAPSISYTQYYPVRRKGRDQQPEVFGFRLVAANIGSFALSQAVRDSPSLAFINGIPIYERFFLGDEFTIRGYNVRSISPIVPLDTFITTRNVVLASNATGTAVAAPGLPASLANLGLLTGSTGNNRAQLTRSFTSVGGDTQLLGNFEYRIPIFGPVTLAAFADVGSAFNLRKGSDQTFSSTFLSGDTFLPTLGVIGCRGSIAGVTLNTLVACNNNSPLALSQISGSLIARDNRLITQEEYLNALNVGPVDPISGLPVGLQQVFLRGEAQTNTVVRLGEGVFSKFSDYRSSIGLEVRFQVPIINVPFRLIYAYNPNARRGTVEELPGIFFSEKKNVFRFSVGRTF
ncbi:MAG: outer membrane protein insertion porin family [Acidobacteriota bacterium]|jgi:outer membrane protein insertion porin family|nr:outer membrane protein insertion porin family [Acidobacteriota bacterium]